MNWTALFEMLSQIAVKGSIMLTVALLAGLFLRKLAAARRYSIWITVLIALAVLPMAIWMLPNWRVLPKTPDLDWPIFEVEVPVTIKPASGSTLPASSTLSPRLPTSSLRPASAPPAHHNSAASWPTTVETLPVIWLAVVVIFLLRLAWSVWHLRCLERSLSDGRCELLSVIAKKSGLKRLPRLLIGPSDAVPMVWGVFRPRLLLPAGFQSWPEGKLRGVLLHELSHLRRGDPAALWLAQWVKALHWFNPLAWMTVAQLRADQECACDDAVLRQGLRPSEYAQHLLDLSRHTRVAPGLALCALTITRSAPVEARVKAILNPQCRREGLTRRWLLGLTGFALLIMLPVAMLHAIEGVGLRGRILDRNGVVLAESTKEKVRYYPHQTLAAHVLGYTGKSSKDDPTPNGRFGMEKQHDEKLKQGRDVALSLDVRIQALTVRAMKEGGVTRGAAVVLDPRTGEILASASLPSYDPNHFVPAISMETWDEYTKDKDSPLLNRAVRGYSPGSAYMPLISLSGIAAGVGVSKFACNDSVIYGSQNFHCWVGSLNKDRHGVLGMAGALAVSCNCFFYQLGNAAGIEQIESMGHKIGFGTRYGILDYEDEGVLPGPSWLKEHQPKQKLTKGFTANVAIGHGMVLATPLQLAVLAATIGNRGKAPQPSLLKVDGVGEWRADLLADGLPEDQFDQVREGMRLVVNGDQSTGKNARSDQVVIAGKTGMAQSWRRTDKGARTEDSRAWFIGFAPFEKPTLAFVILKEGGKSGGSDCAPIAKRIVEETLALPAANGNGGMKVPE